VKKILNRNAWGDSPPPKLFVQVRNVVQRLYSTFRLNSKSLQVWGVVTEKSSPTFQSGNNRLLQAYDKFVLPWVSFRLSVGLRVFRVAYCWPLYKHHVIHKTGLWTCQDLKSSFCTGTLFLVSLPKFFIARDILRKRFGLCLVSRTHRDLIFNTKTHSRVGTLFILFKHQRQRAEATYMPVKSVQWTFTHGN